MGQLDPFFCKGLRVLLVEDETIIAMLTEQMLREMGCDDVHIVGTVPMALSVIDRDPPDLAVLDVNLRGELVTPVAEALRARGVPFVLVSAYDRLDLVAPALAGAPNVGKPFDEGHLLAALTQAIAA